MAPGWYPDLQDSGWENYWDGSRWMGRHPRNSPAHGWYQDPNDPSSQVYWDGHQWTGRRPLANPVTQPRTPPPLPPPRSFDAHNPIPAPAPGSSPPSPYWPQAPSAFGGPPPAKRSGLSGGVRVGIAVSGTIVLIVFVAFFHERILVSDDFRRCVQSESNAFAENMFGVEPRGLQLNEI